MTAKGRLFATLLVAIVSSFGLSGFAAAAEAADVDTVLNAFAVWQNPFTESKPFTQYDMHFTEHVHEVTGGLHGKSRYVLKWYSSEGKAVWQARVYEYDQFRSLKQIYWGRPFKGRSTCPQDGLACANVSFHPERWRFISKRTEDGPGGRVVYNLYRAFSPAARAKAGLIGADFARYKMDYFTYDHQKFRPFRTVWTAIFRVPKNAGPWVDNGGWLTRDIISEAKKPDLGKLLDAVSDAFVTSLGSLKKAASS